MDLTTIPAAVWSGLGAGAMTSLLFYMLATGKLYTRRQHDEVVGLLRADNALLRKANDNLIRANSDLAVASHVAPTALREIAKQAAKAGGEE